MAGRSGWPLESFEPRTRAALLGSQHKRDLFGPESFERIGNLPLHLDPVSL